ncbi:hypothetical protein DHA2_152958 [Giardia duodenalis]|uniref:Uncharacterized protein n=1 Tax=Giardia intestinalis TaxID=5741 RepID=V6TD84_GIAIN|nr:hypothetical protein DHA2_152958 [Giardia intestinalis]
MTSKSSFRAECLLDTRDFQAIAHRQAVVLGEPIPSLDEGLERIKANIFLNTEKPSEIPTERLICYLSDVSQCLQAFVTNSTRAPQVLAGTVRHVDFFDKLYAFLRLLTENGRYHELLEVDADSTCSFLLSVAAFQSAFAREPIFGNPVARSSFLFSAQSFLLTISSVLCHFPLNVDQPISHISAIIGDGTGKLEVAHMLVEHMLIVSSAFNLSDSVSVPAQFFQWLNRVLIHVTPLWSVENLEHLQLWHQSRQSAAEASSPAVHLTDAFPCMLFSSLLRVSLFLYSRRAVGLSTETIALTISSACDLVAQILNTIQTLRNLAAEALGSVEPGRRSACSRLSPVSFLEDAQLFSFFSKLCLWCVRLLDCLISQIFKPDGFSACTYTGPHGDESPKASDAPRLGLDVFTEMFFQHNGWSLLMQLLHYTTDGILDDHMEPPVTELLSQITHCADMGWIKDHGYLCSGFSTRLAYILVKSHSRNAKLAAFYTLCNLVIDQGYAFVAVEHVISACIKNFKSTILTVVYEANRLLVLLLQLGKVEDRDVYQTALLHMINQKITSKLIRSFMMTAQSAQTHQTLPKELRKLASMQLKLFSELIECGKEHEEFITPIFETRDELSIAIEELDVRGPESLSVSCRQLIDLIYM